jgi:hypothetical protein
MPLVCVAIHCQVCVRPSFDDELAKLQDELDTTRRKMEEQASRVAKQIKVSFDTMGTCLVADIGGTRWS